jgi:hypothetical protein
MIHKKEKSGEILCFEVLYGGLETFFLKALHGGLRKKLAIFF